MPGLIMDENSFPPKGVDPDDWESKDQGSLLYLKFYLHCIQNLCEEELQRTLLSHWKHVLSDKTDDVPTSKAKNEEVKL